MPMVPAIQVLVLAGLVRSIAATTGPIFFGVGRPQIDTRWQIIRLIVLIALIYPFTMRWGIVGASITVLASILVATFGFSFRVVRITKCGVQKFGKMIILPLLNAMIMVLIILILKGSIPSTGSWQFLLLTGAGLVSYLIVSYLFDKTLHYGITNIIKENVSLLRIAN